MKIINYNRNIIVIIFLIFSYCPLVLLLDIRISIAFSIIVLSHLFFKKLSPKTKNTIKLTFILLSIALIFSCYGFRIMGLRPGSSLLALMLGLKTFELYRKRDLYILLFLTSFLSVALCLFEQSLWVGLFIFVFVFFFICILYIITISGPSPKEKIPNLDTCVYIFFQAIPLVVILFLFFPRLPSAFFGISDSSTGISGLSTKISPGDFTKLVLSKKVAFRVKFKKKHLNIQNMYFRCAVYSKINDNSWVICTNKKIKFIPGKSSSTKGITYTIYLEPTGNKFIPFLEMTLIKPKIPTISLIQGDFFVLKKNITNPISYNLTSFYPYVLYPLSKKELSNNLDIDWSQNPKTQRLIKKFLKNNTSTKKLIQDIINFFQKDFKYTLNPPPWPHKDPIDFFLFESKKGFCEHFAVAAASMLRYAKIPARVVAGYKGGEINPVGNYLIVRNSNAHAWVEVYLDKKSGWVRFDPTRYIPLENQDPDISQIENIYTYNLPIPAKLAKKILHVWDYINYKWRIWIIGYTSKKQYSFYSKLGLSLFKKNIFSYGILFIVSIMLISIGILFLIISRTRHQDEIFRYYLRFLKKIEKKGVHLKPSLGPMDLMCILYAQNFPLYQKSKYLIELYIKIRYTYKYTSQDIIDFKKMVKSF